MKEVKPKDAINTKPIKKQLEQIEKLGLEWEELLAFTGNPRQKKYLKALSQLGKMTQAVKVAEISITTPWSWRKDEKFTELEDIAKSLYEAIEYDKFSIELEARAMDRTAPMSSVLLLAKMKTLDERYRDKVPELRLPSEITIKLALPGRVYPQVEGSGKDIVDVEAEK